MRKKEIFKNLQLLKYTEFIDTIHYAVCIKHVGTTSCGLKHYECLVGNKLHIICELWIEAL